MGYDEAGRKSRSTNNKRVVKYKASKGADFDDDSIKSIKTITKYDKEGEIKKIKRVKKTTGGGKKTTISKPGEENNPLAPKGATGLVTTKDRENWKFKSPLTQTGMPHDPNNMGAMNQPILDPLTGLPVQPTYANKGMMQQDVNKWKSPDSPLLKKNTDDKIEALNEKYDSGKISEQKYRKKLMKLHSKK